MVVASFSTLSGLYWPASRCLQMPLGLLVTEQFSRVTGFQFMARKTGLSVHRVQGPFPHCRGSLPLGSSYGPLNGSTSYQITTRWWQFCGLTLQEPLPSCPWFAICPYWKLDIPPLSPRPQLEGSLARSIPVSLSVSALSPVSSSCRLHSNPDSSSACLR